ncbi:DUF3306 domain-containing protein [Mameliella alba]|uniref:DUF3306 domain-containing protein n=1 Tax=Mameliella alba TaxID=561184 RepID=UPI000B52D6CE|nr:DUF3306 domain-containing protein [Mameliella alba]MBY6119918.1 DUF3306 domain-containing protein [Mameliella alba]OWV45978.1 hypothetical protein CDZ95_03265 [Mameliella alba]OWV64562.1 hypothetical protein CDZ97_11910 [Mameliella alba]
MSRSPADFWSRRRAAVAAEDRAETQAEQQAAEAEQQRALEDRPDEEILAELNLPAPEEMEDPAQVQALLKAVAPQRLKTRALRRLWRLNPVLANVDGLVDYGDDFTDAARVVENLQSLYQVGKGMFDKAVEQAEAEARAANAERDAIDEAPDQVRDAVATDADDTDANVAPQAPASEPAPLAHFEPKVEPETYAAAPRRMRFRFETST